MISLRKTTVCAKGYTQGIATWELFITAVMLVDKTLHWEKISGAKLVQYSLMDGKRIAYQDVFVTEVGEQYTIDNEARMAPLR